jgi:hypothetical protein
MVSGEHAKRFLSAKIVHFQQLIGVHAPRTNSCLQSKFAGQQTGFAETATLIRPARTPPGTETFA